MKRFVKSPFFPFVIVVVFYALLLLGGISNVVNDKLGYCVLGLYIFAPVAELLCGFLVGKRGVWYKWLFPLTGLLNYFVSFLVSPEKFIKAEFISLTFIAAAPAVIGLLAGSFYSRHRTSKEIDKMSAEDLE